MAELLTIINPNATNREAGDVCVVKEDGWNWSEFERKQFAIVKVPMSVVEAEATYLKSGIPQEVVSAYDEAVLQFRANPTEKNKAAMDVAFYNTADYHQKYYKLDVTALPVEVVQAVQDTKVALETVALEAKDSARAKVEEELIKIDGELLPENLELHTHQIIEVYERINTVEDGAKIIDDTKGSTIKDNLIAASRDGYMAVVKPVLEALPTPPIVEKTTPELTAMTINKYDF